MLRSILSFLCLLSVTSSQESGPECAVEDVTFELVTGYVYSGRDDMIDSRPGTLMLEDCVRMCRENAACQAANFETGLCVLFKSNAASAPRKLPLKTQLMKRLGEKFYSILVKQQRP